MRPQQQNRRMRGRGNGGGGNNNNNNNNQNRRGPNPLTRTYESNGPDVKIRGTAQQVADKYTTLARDAQSSGDRVMAENYLQHAEHYNRIIAAAQAQQQQIQHAQPNQQRIEIEDDMDDDRDEFDPPSFLQAPPQNQSRGQHAEDGSGPQPVIEGVPAEVALEEGAINGNGANGHGEKRQADQEAGEREGEEGGQPRRSRRPRRNNRNRGRDGESEGQGDDAAPVVAGESTAAPAEQTPD